MRPRFLVPALALSALLTSVLVGTAPSPAQAAVVNTPVAGVTITPSAVALGTSARVVVTATNVGAKGMGQVALSVVSPLGWSNLTQPRNGSCRAASGGLLYCLVNSLGAGKTATLSFTVTPAAAGTSTFNSYARNINTMNETYASATLTAG
jgi:hypothetical protein